MRRIPELDEAGTQAAQLDGGEAWWVFRLTLVQQFGLLVGALKILDELGKFLADLTDEAVPPEVRSGTQVLFALVGLLLIITEARTKPPS